MGSTHRVHQKTELAGDTLHLFQVVGPASGDDGPAHVVVLCASDHVRLQPAAALVGETDDDLDESSYVDADAWRELPLEPKTVADRPLLGY